MRIKLSDITLAKNWSRTYGIGDIRELVASMKAHGQIQSVLVTPDNELVAGFRRYHAAKELGWDEIKAEVTEGDPKVVNLIENMNRESLSLWEEIQAIRDVFGSDPSFAEVTRALSKSKTWVKPRVKIWELPQDFINQVKLGNRTIKHINAMLKEKSPSLFSTASRVSKYPKADDIKTAVTALYAAGKESEALALSYAIGGVTREQLLRGVGEFRPDSAQVNSGEGENQKGG